jgi:hypothetical protein
MKQACGNSGAPARVFLLQGSFLFLNPCASLLLTLRARLQAMLWHDGVALDDAQFVTRRDSIVAAKPAQTP